MLYSILIYEPETVTDALPKDVDDARIAQHVAIQDKLRSQGKLGPVARLMPVSSSSTIRGSGTSEQDPNLVTLDGPFAETKEQLVGFYLIEVDSHEEAVSLAKEFPHGTGAIEVRPIRWFDEGNL